jgi:hypothetical protein
MPPVPGQQQCPTPVGQFVDPGCTVPFGFDSSAGAMIDAAPAIVPAEPALGLDAGENGG